MMLEENLILWSLVLLVPTFKYIIYMQSYEFELSCCMNKTSFINSVQKLRRNKIQNIIDILCNYYELASS